MVISHIKSPPVFLNECLFIDIPDDDFFDSAIKSPLFWIYSIFNKSIFKVPFKAVKYIFFENTRSFLMRSLHLLLIFLLTNMSLKLRAMKMISI